MSYEQNSLSVDEAAGRAKQARQAQESERAGQYYSMRLDYATVGQLYRLRETAKARGEKASMAGIVRSLVLAEAINANCVQYPAVVPEAAGN